MNFKNSRLRKMEESDLETVLRWRNSDRIRANMYNDNEITIDEHKKWFTNIKKSKRDIYMIFEYKGRPNGLVSFNNIDYRNNKCFWGFYLGEENVPKGTGLVMGVLGLKYIFETIKIRKLIGEAFAFNNASINFHKKLGFIEEGRYVKHVLKNGIYEDVISFALFKDKWQENKNKLEELIFNN